MLENVGMPVFTTVIIVALTVLALTLIYAAAHWLRRRQNKLARWREAGAPSFPAREGSKRLEHAPVPPHMDAIPDPVPHRSPELSVSNPKILGKLRSGREGTRPSEDDLAQQQVGLRGLPGEHATANELPEKITQIPKPLDPGHTA